jgi:antirestriction protein ArdC
MKAEQIRQQTTNRLIQIMETSGDRPWRQPWSLGANVGPPTSGDTRKAYRGSNALSLDITSMVMGYKTKNWNTFENWKKHGIFPKQGQKATWLFYFGQKGEEVEQENGDKKTKWTPFLRTFFVFNAEQCHGDKLPEFLVQPEGTAAYEINYDSFDELIKRHGITIDHDAHRAAYSPTSDKVYMPKRGHFNSVAEYYNTLAHELCHWTESRTGYKRNDKGKHNEEYADYELSAEIGAAYLMRELGLPAVETEKIIENSAIYLKGWLKKLKDDNTFIYKAAGRAGRLVNFLVGRNDQGETIATPEVKQETALAVA